MNRTTAETVRLLCLSVDSFVQNDSINVTQAAKAIGLNQSTLKRILDGESENPRLGNAQKLCKYFKITMGQLIGKERIEGIDSGDDEKEYYIQKVAKIMKEHPEKQQQILDFVEVYVSKKS